MPSTDTTHEHDGVTVVDTEVPFETNEHGDVWCAQCGERLLITVCTSCGIFPALQVTVGGAKHLCQQCLDRARARFTREA